MYCASVRNVLLYKGMRRSEQCSCCCSYCGVLIDQIIIIACLSCGESFRKRGRPQKTAQVYGFSVGRNGGRPHTTARESGSFV